MRFINLTPHPIAIISDGGLKIRILNFEGETLTNR